jgi:hypothetical protein
MDTLLIEVQYFRVPTGYRIASLAERAQKVTGNMALLFLFHRTSRAWRLLQQRGVCNLEATISQVRRGSWQPACSLQK